MQGSSTREQLQLIIEKLGVPPQDEMTGASLRRSFHQFRNLGQALQQRPLLLAAAFELYRCDPAPLLLACTLTLPSAKLFRSLPPPAYVPVWPFHITPCSRCASPSVVAQASPTAP